MNIQGFTSAGEGRALTRKAMRVGALAVLGALVPLVVVATLTLTKSEAAVRDEVGARLRLTTALSSALIAEQVGSIVSLIEGAAKRPRLVHALADGDPDRFVSAARARPFVVSIATYVRAPATSGQSLGPPLAVLAASVDPPVAPVAAAPVASRSRGRARS